ncbi:hypothetical protein IE4872_PC00486 (plasmid) [Rhizobium gallicum]|uniref:Uncharacterized protein n=1 Tax=Rhizobium gallicum TaxID=56730 RepID=A0A1L5NRG8_9HYPH|nr:hypothetical protein IE4872_PC00486 [Rhizobium gallicum]
MRSCGVGSIGFSLPASFEFYFVDSARLAERSKPCFPTWRLREGGTKSGVCDKVACPGCDERKRTKSASAVLRKMAGLESASLVDMAEILVAECVVPKQIRPRQAPRRVLLPIAR